MSLSLFPSRDQRPLFWLSGRPIYTVSFLVSLYVAATIAISLLLAIGHQDLVQLFIYNSAAVARGEVWRLATYSFVNIPNIWFALEMVMLYYFGRLIESGLGSNMFALFYGGLILLQGALFQAGYLLNHTAEAQQGIAMVNMALFAAFVTMVPSASFFFGVAARWILLLLLGLSSLQFLAEHQWASIIQLLVLSVAAVFFMKAKGYREALYFFSSKGIEHPMKYSSPVPLPSPKIEEGDCRFTGSTLVASMPTEGLKKSRNSLPSASQQEAKKKISMIHIDQLLDKINETGLSSLTKQEKEKLEAARMALLKRDQEN